MRIVICDDDREQIEQLTRQLRQFFTSLHSKLPDIASFESGEALLADTGSKDIVFLDIEMAGLNGIYVGKALKEQNKNTIIFIITSYVEYLDDAMRFHVFRYLTKPLNPQRLYDNLKEALHLYNTLSTTIAIETKDGLYTYNAYEIICVEAQARKVILYTLQRELESINSIDYWDEALSLPCFFRCHRSFIVNMKYIDHFDHSLIHLCNDRYTAYLTRRKYSELREKYLLYLESTR